MPDSVEGILMAELQAFRADYNTNARENGERLSALETEVRTLTGNGQPGRIARLEEDVDRLKAFRWWIVGLSAGVGAIVSIILKLSGG